MLKTIRRTWAKWTRDERATCADCGRVRGVHVPGSTLYFIPLCESCARRGGVNDWCARFDPQVKQWVDACMAGIFEEPRSVREAEKEADAKVHELRLQAYEYAKRGLAYEAHRCTLEADRTQAEWDAKRRTVK